MNVRPDLAAEAFRRGASAYVVKHCAAEDLIVAVRRVVKGRSCLSPQISKETVDCLRWTGAAEFVDWDVHFSGYSAMMSVISSMPGRRSALMTGNSRSAVRP